MDLDAVAIRIDNKPWIPKLCAPSGLYQTSPDHPCGPGSLNVFKMMMVYPAWRERTICGEAMVCREPHHGLFEHLLPDEQKKDRADHGDDQPIEHATGDIQIEDGG